MYKAFDCRVQRYLVQGIIDAFRDSGVMSTDFQIEFKSTIPAGAETCLFVVKEKQEGEEDKWENYSRVLAQKALKSKKNE